jgi:hypothetical protein
MVIIEFWMLKLAVILNGVKDLEIFRCAQYDGWELAIWAAYGLFCRYFCCLKLKTRFVAPWVVAILLGLQNNYGVKNHRPVRAHILRGVIL